ncbi:MAG: FAD:protein FMN transferase [Chitinophagaceae bacterium]|nr:MAG: FAD:protein FMN transferase [Chitinophagaceae bacterium]
MGFVVALLALTSFLQTPLQRIQITGQAQGTTYSIIYYANDTAVSQRSIDSLLNKIDHALSIYKNGSLINRFNASKKGVKVDHHMANVVSRAIEIYQETDGLFDITVMPLTEAWGFARKRDTSVPSDETIKSLLPCIGSNHISLKAGYLAKDKPCTKIDVNGIAQGYSVDLLAQRLEASGIHDYIVELGGEIRVSGRKPGNERMKIGIESPSPDDIEEGIFKRVLIMDSGAITTSGNYRKYYESKGRHITHLFNPKTGYSINNELIAVTVYASDAMTADGYDNALMNMGLARSFEFLSSGKVKLEAYFIYRDKEGNVRDTASAGFYKLLYK